MVNIKMNTNDGWFDGGLNSPWIKHRGKPALIIPGHTSHNWVIMGTNSDRVNGILDFFSVRE